eukprot:symbB.v1.2.032906.t1/scaffold3915.1/size48385/1
MLDHPVCNNGIFNASEVRSLYRVSSDVADLLANSLPDLARTSPSVRKSNRGGWHSAGSVLINSLTSSTARKLRSAFFSSGGDYVRRVANKDGGKLHGEVQLTLMGTWANVGSLLQAKQRQYASAFHFQVNREQDSNVAHMHPGLVSGVLYVETAVEAATVLAWPLGNGIAGASFSNSESDVSTPFKQTGSLWGPNSLNGIGMEGLKRGDLLIFPAWLQHHVPPQYSKGLRMSVAFNLGAYFVKKNAASLKFILDQDLRFDPSAVTFADMELGRPSFDVQPWLAQGLHQRLRPPESLARGSHDDTENSLAKFHLAWEVSWLSSSTTLTMWACFVLGAQILIFPHPKKERMFVARTGAQPSSISMLTLPANFVQVMRHRQPLATWANTGFQAKLINMPSQTRLGLLMRCKVLSGEIKLWLHDPRSQVEVAAASDPIARQLYGQKVALDMVAGTMVIFPAFVFFSVEAKVASALLYFTL